MGGSNNTMNTKPMVEGAMLTALTIVLCLAGTYIPVLGSFIQLFWPVPIAVLVFRHGLRVGVLATVVSGLLLLMLTGPINFVITILGFGLLGLVLGFALRRKLSAPQIILWGAVASAVSILAMLGLTIWMTGQNPIDMMISIQMKSFKQSMPMLIELAKNSGNSRQATQMQEMVKEFPRLMHLILPAALVVAAVFSSFLNFVVASKVLTKMRTTVPKLPPFTMWRFPVWTAYVYIIGLGLTLFSKPLHSDQMFALGYNIVVSFSYVFLIGGISLMIYFFKRTTVPKRLKVVAAILAFVFIQLVFQVIIYIGIFDSIFNYRAYLIRRGFAEKTKSVNPPEEASLPEHAESKENEEHEDDEEK